MLGHIYNFVYKFLYTKHVIDDNYKSAFHVVSNPRFDIWLNAEGDNQEKKATCLKELKHYLENIEIISNYILLDDSQEERREKLLDSLKQEISTASILADVLERNPNKYDALVSGAKEYAKSKQGFQNPAPQENHKPITEEPKKVYNEHDEIHHTEADHVADINSTNQTNITAEYYE